MTGAPSPCHACGSQSNLSSLEPRSKARSCFRNSSSIPLHERDQQRSARTCSSLSTTRRSWTIMRTLMFAICLGIIFCSRGVRAIDSGAGEIALREGSTMHFDEREAPPPPMRFLGRLEGRDRRKHTTMQSSTVPTPTSTTTTIPQNSSSSTSTAAAGLVTATGGPTTLPRPFDGALGRNFTTSSCPAFFRRFLTNRTFVDCLPFSLLLQTSNSFFAASRDPTLLTQTLTAACNVNYPQCSALMSSLATEIQTSTACSADLKLQNPLVQQAYAGFMAYDPLYHAGCLKSTTPTSPSPSSPSSSSSPVSDTSASSSSSSSSASSNDSYCFLQAATNLSAPSSSYVYYLPLGLSMPGGTMPACTKCLQETMQIFRSYADSGQSEPLQQNYAPAAQLVDMYCGPDFVEESVVSTSGAAGMQTSLVGSPLYSALVLVGMFVAGWVV